MGGNLQYKRRQLGVFGAGYNRPMSSRLTPAPIRRIAPFSNMFNVGGFVGFGPVIIYAQYLKREKKTRSCDRKTFKTLWCRPGQLARHSRHLVPCSSIPLYRHDARGGRPPDSVAYHVGISWRFGNNTLYGVYNYGKDDGRSLGPPKTRRPATTACDFYEFSAPYSAVCGGSFGGQQRLSRMSLHQPLHDGLHTAGRGRCPALQVVAEA